MEQPHRYSADTLTSLSDPDKLNDILEGAGHGRPLTPTGRMGDRFVLSAPQALAAQQVLEQAGAGDVRPDPVLFIGTARIGRDVGHGFAWAEVSLAAGDVPPVPPWTPPPPGLRRPVVALLDTGVEDHPWLRVGTPEDPFLIDAAALPDPCPVTVEPSSPLDEGDDLLAGHGTFNAGLLRLGAPSARVLSVRVMNDEGRVKESNLIIALEWLRKYAQDNPLDVVCMPFGRAPFTISPSEEMRGALEPLARAGVALVASAGNDHSDTEIFPAAFDIVTAVGAGFGQYHATFSNHGDWVDRYRDGVDLLGVLPPDRWVRWTGTSFAAVTFAADLARPQLDHGHV
ncbi:hypothetical protein Ade02nite_55420 [Paractinoplanes deccanensis]|uniref:Peptidase S8/S53 domain-containing protein n=1 Tax=Paractinoplanes deccanensis TaxID=113561 RepID=A0ABQ3YA97_9ACTN|nr:S8 family serine peptidase [Actinoplanes deccanensis]GID76901.1 hypothetical protein Ade02nite_55420 [Actinoplanes deccanensis]